MSNAPPSPTILLVDDDQKTVELVKLYLKNDGFYVDVAYEGREAIRKARDTKPSLVILDLMLPKIDGLDVCRAIRAESRVPIIMLTARTTEDDKLRGLNLGADDYITKPFSPREVVARVHAVLRRAGQQKNVPVTQLVFKDLVIDYNRHEARIDGAPIHLTPKEFKLLGILAKKPGQPFSRADLMEQAFGEDYPGQERTIDVHMMNLRKKLEISPDTPEYIVTVYGKGYKFQDTFE